MKPSHLPIDHRWFLDNPPESSQLLVGTSIVIACDELPSKTTGRLHRFAEHRLEGIGPADCGMKQIPEDHDPCDFHLMDLLLQAMQGRLGSARGDSQSGLLKDRFFS
jgi:hypothetical protein